MVHIEERITGARDRVHHLLPDASMAGAMRLTLDAVPRLRITCRPETGIHVRLNSGLAGEVADSAVEAVLVDLIARTQVVHVACEWAVGNTTLSANAVTTKAELSIEDL